MWVPVTLFQGARQPNWCGGGVFGLKNHRTLSMEIVSLVTKVTDALRS